jgi:class 3 adenylate cyclase
VNLAARLEGLIKNCKHKILMNDRVRAAVEMEIPCQALGRFKIKA